jgi:hypothetical protein
VTWLLDTSVISELRKGPRADSGVRRWIIDVVDSELFTSVIAVGEIRRGVELLRRRDAVAAAALNQWLLRLTETFGDRILPVDLLVAERWGRLGVPDALPVAEGLIAATALVHDLTLVTRDTCWVGRAGVRTVDPFTA